MGNRRHIRISAALRVDIQNRETSESASYMTKDLSLGGVFLLDAPHWPIGTELPLKIVRGLRQLELLGQVVRHDASGVGIAFVDPGVSAEAAIEEMVIELVALGYPFDERRGEPRHPIDIAVTWRHGAVEETSRIRDLSFKGAFILSDNKPPVGETCYVYLPALEEESQRAGVWGCEARVMHARDEGFGVQFQRPSEGFRTSVSRLVQWLEAETSGT